MADGAECLKRGLLALAEAWEHGDAMVLRARYAKPSEYAAALREVLSSAGEDAVAETSCATCAEIGDALRRCVDELERRSLGRVDGNAPGHGHLVPGVWDDDNGKKAGTRCEWCAAWPRIRALAAAEEAERVHYLAAYASGHLVACDPTIKGKGWTTDPLAVTCEECAKVIRWRCVQIPPPAARTASGCDCGNAECEGTHVIEPGTEEAVRHAAYQDGYWQGRKDGGAAARTAPTFFDKRGADALAVEVQKLIDRKVIDSRSPAADALLDYLNPGPNEQEMIAERAARTATTGAEAKSAIDAFLFLADVGYGVRLSADQTRALAAEIRAHPGEGERALRAKIEALAKEWDDEAARRDLDALRAGRNYEAARDLKRGASFERNHAARLRALAASSSGDDPRDADLAAAPVATAAMIRAQALDEAARVVEQCNREGPYEAIGAAKRIRALAGSDSLPPVSDGDRPPPAECKTCGNYGCAGDVSAADRARCTTLNQGSGVSDLRCFTDDVDTCIAASVDDALAVMRESQGADGLDPEAWGPCLDDEKITIHCDAEGTPATPGDPGVAPVTKTAAEWAKRGRGFLCTTEF